MPRRKKMEKIRWGVLGTAGIARDCSIPGMQKAENCERYGIAGRSLKKAEDYKDMFGFEKAYEGYEALLSDPKVQAVYIPLPNNLHYEWVKKAIVAGKHVLCEKPLAPTPKQTVELFEAAKEKGVFLMEAYAYLHSPFVTVLKKEIEEGTIGEIRYIESQFLTSYYDKSNIRLHKENYGGAVYDLGCYNTSMLLKLLEDMPSRVKAMAQYDENGVDIYTAALLNYENDVRASITCGMIFEKDKPHRYDRLYIHGTKGDIKSDTKFNQEGNASYTLIIEGKEQIRNVYCPHNYQLEIEQLGRCIIEGETPVVTADFSIKNAKILDAILQEIGYFESNVM